MKQTLLVTAVLAIAFGMQSLSNAAIIVTFQQTSLPTAQNVSVDVFASADAGSQLVGDYGFTVTLNAPANNITTTRVPATNSTTSWGGLDSTTSSGLTFRGGLNSQGVTADPFNITIGTGQNASTRIGSVNFVALTGSYTLSAVAASTARNLTPGGTGFFVVTGGPSSQQVPGAPNGFAVTNGNITAVPEPSSIALVALCACGLGFGIVRARRNRKS